MVLYDGCKDVLLIKFFCLFYLLCSGLTSVIIGSSVKELGYQAFSGCMSITTIKFNGPMAQWKGVSKGYDWHYGFPSTTVVTCTDGTVPLD